jgi:predicted DNA-binding protein
MGEDKEKLKIELSRLYTELEDLKKALPAHTIRPHQLIAIEDIEYRINEIEKKLKD